jgi:D-inositol-3-phosphate glycosyltransferase
VTASSSSVVSTCRLATRTFALPAPRLKIALLTGGGDKPYALGMAAALTSADVSVDFIGSDDLDVPEVRDNPRVTFLNLRGDQSRNANFAKKVTRVLSYYGRLVRYAATAEPELFHLLWNNKFEVFDRTLLLFYYKALGKRVVFTAHNVNARERDGNDSLLNRVSLRIQYHFVDHIFVHTEAMKRELLSGFALQEAKVTVIPFGINNTVAKTALTSLQAKQQLGLSPMDKALLFFGNIAPYKGLEYLVTAFDRLLAKDRNYRLLIVGCPKGPANYWNQIRQTIRDCGLRDRVLETIEYVPDDATEIYFKAADVLILPYTRIFQSGVLLLGYSFGLPVIAADVGSLRAEVIEGRTGFIFAAQDSGDLAKTIERYFTSELYCQLGSRRPEIVAYGNEVYSWDKVAGITKEVYSELLRASEGRRQSAAA